MGVAAPTVAQALVPLADRVARHAQAPESAARPPDVAARLEERERARTRLEGLGQPAGDDVDMGEARLGEGAHVLEAGAVGELGRLAAIGDRDLGARAGEAVQEAGPR